MGMNSGTKLVEKRGENGDPSPYIRLLRRCSKQAADAKAAEATCMAERMHKMFGG